MRDFIEGIVGGLVILGLAYAALFVEWRWSW